MRYYIQHNPVYDCWEVILSGDGRVCLVATEAEAQQIADKLNG